MKYFTKALFVRNNRLRYIASRQSGVVLLVSLLFLIVLTLIGVAASRMVTSEERQSRYLREYSTAFEAAEAALRDARDEFKQLLATNSGKARASMEKTNRIFDQSKYSSDCKDGLCQYDNSESNPPWKIAANWANAVSYGTYTLRSPLPSSNVVGDNILGGSGKDEKDNSKQRYNNEGSQISYVNGVSRQPLYLIEAIPDTRPGTKTLVYPPKDVPYIYRITARGFGADPNSQATVQEMYVEAVNSAGG
jgi:type IV pilus assembly protein PilX